MHRTFYFFPRSFLSDLKAYACPSLPIKDNGYDNLKLNINLNSGFERIILNKLKGE